MKVRFVAGNTLVSRAIIWQSKTAMPFTPSHVETVTEDGKYYIGAHIDGGTQARLVGYDKAETVHELILDLPSNPVMDQIFWDYMKSRIGEPYDWTAIIGFVIPEHFHKVNTAICSATTTLGLRKCGWFPAPLAVPAHLISPRDLLLMISSRIPIPGI
jgi:hypothetical protein